MTLPGIALYAGGAALHALAFGAAGLAAWRLSGRPVSRAGAALVLSTLFFIFLALLPFPDPAALDCSQGGLRPRLRPFAFVTAALRAVGRGAGLSYWLGDLTVVSAAMNFFLCLPIGLALGALTGRWRHAVLFGAALTLGVELTQLTGNWGIYPCPYRRFDLDDLILNLSGVLAGFGLARRLRAPDRA